MPPVFHPDEIAVFDRAGNPLGALTGWSIDQPRSFRLNEIEDFTFSIARENQATGEVYLTADVVNRLLRRHNLVYLASETTAMRPWVGYIKVADYGDGKCVVTCVGAAGLLKGLTTTTITQDGGLVWTIASRLVSAAQAKQAAHGDLVVQFDHVETPGAERPNYGKKAFQGDVLAALQGLASRTVTEFYMDGRIRIDGTLRIGIEWGGRFAIDHTDIAIADGTGGSLQPGTHIVFNSEGVVNSATLTGVRTDLGQYVDYDSVRQVIKDVTPTSTMTLDPALDTHRRVEAPDLTTDFGYSVDVEKALAQQIQERYLGYFKSFLYAYHRHYGKPWLDGYDWAGPNGVNDKRLTAHFGRTVSRLGIIGHRTVILGDADDDDTSVVEARIDDWHLLTTITPVAHAVGVAANYLDTGDTLVADQTTGTVVELDSDHTTTTLWGSVVGGGETLRAIATDPVQATVLWVLVTSGTTATVKSYNINDQSLLSAWSVTAPNATDIAVSAENGVLWMVGNDGVGNVTARDLNSGAVLTTGDFLTFASGFADPTGLSVSGDLAYVVNSTGNVRMLFLDGNFAGNLATGTSAGGVFADLDGGLVWMLLSSGSIRLYTARLAVAAAGGDGIVEGAPGFEQISAGRFVHVVFNTDSAARPHPRTNLFVVWSHGAYVTSTVTGPPGEPDQLQRQWVTGDQHTGWINRTKVRWAANEQVIQGEEARVDEWDPKADGYGYFGLATYRTRRGATIKYGNGWRLTDWDVPESTFEPDPPPWPEGDAQLAEYLAKANMERAVQVLKLLNVGDLFRKIELGGIYTVNVSHEGPPGGFPPAQIRVLAYTPDERQGGMEVIGEWL